mgnify:CR=1 FL=1
MRLVTFRYQGRDAVGALVAGPLLAISRAYPPPPASGIGMAAFDIERMGFDEGEEILPGIRIQADGGGTGNFRILCDGDHLAELEAEQAEVVEAVSTQPAAVPVGVPEREQRK